MHVWIPPTLQKLQSCFNEQAVITSRAAVDDVYEWEYVLNYNVHNANIPMSLS